MGFWDIFKKKKEEPVEIEKLAKDDLAKWLEKKKLEISHNEGELFLEVKQRISKLIQELTTEISVLNNVDFNEKKEKERIKAIVQENFNNYIINLERLIGKLEELENPSDIVKQINQIFHDFETKSKANYAKATYLIGKELGDTKESIRNFFKDIEAIIIKYKNHIEESQTTELIEDQIQKYNESKKAKSTIVKEIEEQSKKVKEINSAIKKEEERLENIKKSEEYLENQKKEQELKIKKENQEKNISNLKQLINFKSLANFYHKYEKEMNIVKEYKENFKYTLKRKKGEDIINLLIESKLHTQEISEQIEKINKTEQEITNTKIENKEIDKIKDATAKLVHEEHQINSEQEAKQKTLNKFEENENNELDSLKQKFKEINIELN